MSDELDSDDDFEDLADAAELDLTEPVVEADEIVAEFDEEDFDVDFDDEFEEEVEGEYALEHDKYGEEFRAEFGHLEVDDDQPPEPKNKKKNK